MVVNSLIGRIFYYMGFQLQTLTWNIHYKDLFQVVN